MIEGIDHQYIFLEQLEMWETILISILIIFSKNAEIIVIYYVFYWLQRRVTRKDLDIKLSLAPSTHYPTAGNPSAGVDLS